MTMEAGVKALAEVVAADVKALEDGKVDKELGKGLSESDYTTAEKTKLTGIAAGATKNRADSANADKAHTHPWSQVTGAPAQATRWPTFAEVTGQPANYPTTWASVAAIPSTATRWPTFDEVSGKPTTFAPSTHTHPVGQITGLSDAATTTVATIRAGTAGTANRAGTLTWTNYGGGQGVGDGSHIIFDASNSKSPSGSAVDNTNPVVAWGSTYPTLMGWNGSATYGVRVDRARYAESLTSNITINGVAANVGSNITVADGTKLPLSGGTLTGSMTYQNVSYGGWARGIEGRIASTGAMAGGLGVLGSSDTVSTFYMGMGESPWQSGNGVRVTSSGVTIEGATNVAGNLTIWGYQVYHTGNMPATYAPSWHNHTSLSGTVSFSGSTGNAYNNSNIVVNGNGTANTLKPSIGFHQPGLYAGTLTQLDGNTFQFQNQSGTPAFLANTCAPTRSTNTVEGGIKTRTSGSTLWMTNNGANA